MTTSKDYFTQRNEQIRRKKRIVTLIGLLGFGGSILFGGFSTIQRGVQQPEPTVVESAESQLAKQIKGYELVLQSEPDNRVALEKLSLLKLQLGDNQGAIPLLERLVKLYPDRQDYQTILNNTKLLITENNHQN